MGKNIILVPHCFMIKRFTLQHRDDTEEVLKILLENETGIVQMPCPHFSSMSNLEKNVLINKPNFSSLFCSRVKNYKYQYTSTIESLVNQMEMYKQLNLNIVGLLGIKGSPICGVKSSSAKGINTFTEMLFEKLQTKGIKLQLAAV